MAEPPAEWGPGAEPYGRSFSKAFVHFHTKQAPKVNELNDSISPLSEADYFALPQTAFVDWIIGGPPGPGPPMPGSVSGSNPSMCYKSPHLEVPDIPYRCMLTCSIVLRCC